MKVRKAFCLFEQSGTFKNEFKKLGIDAEDYDINNEFGETDFQMDLFKQIEIAYGGGESIFDQITPDDVIMCFFPCIRFENQIMLFFRGQAYQQKNLSLKEKMQQDIQLLDEVNEMYKLVNHLFIVCIDKNLRLIMENPYSEEHFLRRYWCYSPAIIDRDRRDNGDYFKKPTQYWFLNCEPEQNIIFEPLTYNAIDNHGADAWKERRLSDYKHTGAKNIKTARSMLHPDYANRFIRQYIIDCDGGIWK